jgi:LysM repeat protein
MKIRLLLLLVFLVMPSVVSAAGQDEPTIYVIKQGDTLWGLSERFIKDPNYWPNMWSKNGQITNPHFIYPGQKVRVFPDRLELVPVEAASIPVQKSAPAASAAAVETLQGVAVEKTYTLYGSEGFLAEKEFRPFGLVVGAQHDRIVTGVDDIVYTDIGGDLNAKGGDKFSIYLKDTAVKHPLNNVEMGFKLVPLGALQLTDVEKKSSRAIITQSFREISPGAYLLPYKENRRREISLKEASTDLKGYMIESLNGTSVIAAGDVVYIDLGSSQGVAVGNLLYVVRDVMIDQRYVEGRIDALPQEVLGALVILDVGKKTSTALVVKSIDSIYKGDRIVSQPK